MSVSELDCHRLTRDAREYARRVVVHGEPAAVLWYNRPQSDLFRSIVNKELEKYGLNPPETAA